MEMFEETLKQFQQCGSAEWNGCSISDNLLKTFPWKEHGHSSNSRADLLCVNLYSILTGSDIPTVKAYVLAKANTESSLMLAEEHGLNDDSCNISANESQVNVRATSSFSVENLLPLHEANKFLSLLTYCIVNGLEDASKLLPVLVFCDGYINKRKTYFLLLRQAADGSSSVVTETISCAGPSASQLWKNKAKNAMESVWESQKSFGQVSAYYNDNKVASKAVFESYAEYNVFGTNTSLSKMLEKEDQMASTMIAICSNKVESVLDLNTDFIKSIHLSMNPVPGHLGSHAYELYREIVTLEGLMSAFGPNKEVRWAEQEENSDKDCVAKLKKAVLSFSNPLKTSTDKPDSNQTDKDDGSAIKQQFFTPRKELDFTEKVWETLKLVNSTQALTEGLAYVMKEIESGRSARFWLHEDNDTTLSKLVRQSYAGQATVPSITGLLPIKLVAEIGVEKLRRDYLSFFLSNKLSTLGRLQQFMEWKNGSSDEEKLLAKFNGLLKLHHVAELALHCLSSLNLSQAKVLKVVRSALQSYAEGSVDFSKTFRFPVQYSDVKMFVEGRDPHLWRLSVRKDTTRRGGEKICSVCWSSDNPIAELLTDFQHDSSVDHSDGETDVECLQYYVTVKTESAI